MACRNEYKSVDTNRDPQAIDFQGVSIIFWVGLSTISLKWNILNPISDLFCLQNFYHVSINSTSEIILDKLRHTHFKCAHAL